MAKAARRAGYLAGVSVIGTGHDAVALDLDGDGSLQLVTLDTAWHDGQTEWQLAVGSLEGDSGHERGTLTGEPTSHEVR